MFRFKQNRQINHHNSRQGLPHQPLPFQQPLDALADGFPGYVQKLGGGGHQLFLRQETVAAGQVIIQFKQNPCLNPAGIISGHAQLNGESVHCPEGGLQSLLHQKVRIIVNQLQGALPVKLIGPHRQIRRQMVQGKKLHQLADSHLKPELFANGPGLFPGNTRHFRQSLRFPLHDRQGFAAKALHNPGGHFRANALDYPAAQIIQDLHGGLGHQPFQKFRLKLPAVAGVGAPLSGDQQPLPHRRHGDGPHHGDILPPAYRQAQHSVAVVIILIDNGADGPLYHFQIFRQSSVSPSFSLSGSSSAVHISIPCSFIQTREFSSKFRSTTTRVQRTSPRLRSHT